jgi:hypothetical protein
MNRCPNTMGSTVLRRACTGLTLSFLLVTAGAQTVGRPIPPHAQRGTLEVTQPPNVLLNGQPDRLSPGARIRGDNNLLTLSGTLVGKTLAVRYVREPQGQIHDVWILTATEMRQSQLGIP